MERLCTILGLSRPGFCYWRRTASARTARQAVAAGIAARIRKVRQDSDGTFGAPGTTAGLREEGGPAVSHKSVARTMRTTGLRGVRLRRRYRTTAADQTAARAPDLTGRDSTATAANRKYVGDITYLPVSGTKPLYPRPSPTSPHADPPGGRSLATWEQNSSSTPWRPQSGPAETWPERSCTRTADLNLDQGLRGTLQVGRRPAEHRRNRPQRRQRRSGKLQRRLQEADTQRPRAWPSEREARLDAFRRLTRYDTRRRHSLPGQLSPIAYENALRPTTTLTQAA
ncbi:IS3 family transposase [Streptomyces sp. NRRL F-2664]|uniref:IS3 family transposase n=1 Tax=Streptomyces sp. NRRL F-2664 TaxID=1463842 RepID=UPI00131E0B65